MANQRSDLSVLATQSGQLHVRAAGLSLKLSLANNCLIMRVTGVHTWPAETILCRPTRMKSRRASAVALVCHVGTSQRHEHCMTGLRRSRNDCANHQDMRRFSRPESIKPLHPLSILLVRRSTTKYLRRAFQLHKPFASRETGVTWRHRLTTHRHA